MSHPSRVSGLKLSSMKDSAYKSLSHPSRVSGLKCLILLAVVVEMASHPSRVSGLKCLQLLLRAGKRAVSPFAGEWIEILKAGRQDITSYGLTLRG